MEKDQEIAKFIDEIRDKFPDVSIQIDKWMLRQGVTPEDKWYWSMMEAFSQATTDAIKNSDEQLAISHLSFVSEKLKIASKIKEEFIDGRIQLRSAILYVMRLLAKYQQKRPHGVFYS